tara:strand:- start:134 stop:571 length:438 start_codon:yes stop_codon:yes gene_type:complete
MYFWRIEKLKKSLSENKPSKKDVFCYYLGLTILTVIFLNLPIETFSNISYRWIEWGVMIISSLVSLIGSYIANGGSNGVDFFERFFSIFFVLNIRYSVFTFLAVILIAIISGGIDYEKNTLIISTLFCFLMSYKGITHINEVSSS